MIAQLRIKDFFSGIYLAVIYYIFLFQYQFSYNFIAEINTHFSLIFFSLAAFSFYLLLYFLSEKTLKFTLTDAALFALFTGFLCCIMFNQRVLNLNNEIFVCYVIMLMVFFLLRSSSPLITHYFVPLLVLFFFIIELVIGIKQYFLFRGHQEDLALAIKGSLQNSGVYSYYLILNLPLNYFLLKKFLKNQKIKILIFGILTILVAFILYVTESRTAIISLLIFELYFLKLWFFNAFRSFLILKRNRFLSSLIFLIIVSFCIYLLVNLKPASTAGRLFVWRITATHVSQNLLSGIGIGNFAFFYPKWQIQYIASQSHLDIGNFLNADDSHVAMNEFLEIFAETGLLGFLSFAWFIIYLLRSRLTDHKELMVSAKLTLILILVAALFSYPLHCNAIAFLFTFCCALLVTNSANGLRIIEMKQKYNRIGFLLFQVFLSVSIIISFRQYRVVYAWNTVRNNVFATPSEIKTKYAELYPSLKGNGKFLLDFGEHLLEIDQSTYAARILEESKSFYISYRTYLSAADAYYQSKNIPAAIKNLEDVSHLVPYKFYPKYQLTRLYYKSGNSVEGKAMANFILSMPVKKPSADVIRIKQEVRDLMKQ